MSDQEGAEEFSYTNEQKSAIDKLLIPIVEAEPCMYDPAARKANKAFTQEKFLENVSHIMSSNLEGFSKFFIIFAKRAN